MKAINNTICSCKKYLDNQTWKAYNDFDEMIIKSIRKQYPKSEVTLEKINIPGLIKEKLESKAEIIFKGEELKIKFFLKLAKCDLCSKEGTEYFEATIQIRSSSNKILEEGIKLLKSRVENLKGRGVFINKAEKKTDGFDLFMTNKRLALSLSQELFNAYGGELKASPRLFTRNRQSGKNLYRINIFLKLPGFSSGDAIINHDKAFLVEKTGPNIKLYDLEKNCFVTTNYDKMDCQLLKKHSTYVSKVQPYIEVINPFDFQSSLVKNQYDKNLELGQEVKVVVHKGIFLV